MALIVTACAAGCASPLSLSTIRRFRSSQSPRQGGDVALPASSTPTSRGIMMSRGSPDDSNSYNDDAFGLVFLTGGILSQDADFVGTFAILSAFAAACTRIGHVTRDARAPAAVATATLLVSPMVASIRRYGSLEYVAPPLPVELGLCLISVIWAFANKSREDSD
jgi:hypothetical protein